LRRPSISRRGIGNRGPLHCQGRAGLDHQGIQQPYARGKRARLETVKDEDLPRLSNSADFYSISETNRRLTLALQREARRTTVLTLVVAFLTAALVWLTVVLVRMQPSAPPPAPSAQSALPAGGPGALY
jgi:hypothetical protein